MADQQHLDILRRGVWAWNKWRRVHLNVRLDLKGADLREVNLREIDPKKGKFGYADLSYADLSKANFAGAYLNGVKFVGTDLNGANFSGAVLNGNDLTGANLYAANLSRTVITTSVLIQANLSYANLSGADLAGTILGHTVFAQADLSEVKNLGFVHHGAPSEIGISTIYRSGGNIPESFLRGAGVPDTFIMNMRALVGSMSPLDFYSCFISYSSEDQPFADRLYADLQSRGVRCWLASEDMKIGDKIRPRIDEAIRLYDKLLLVLSEHSVASQWVEHEVETAIGKELEGKLNVLFPIRLDQAVMNSKTGWASHVRLTRHIGDFTRWKNYYDYREGLSRLLRDLKAGSGDMGR
jgi:uncharacterized protein YjbI with pentapeptide repeats